MGTRSRIAIKNDDGSFTSIYTHWDGYPSGNGKVLKEHYTDPAKVNELIALGDLGEEDIAAKHSADFQHLLLLTDNCDGEYLYIFDEGNWLVGDIGAGSSTFDLLRPVEKVIAEYYEQ